MKQFLLFFLILFSFSTFSSAQSLETGLRLYQEGDYERALRVFDDFDEPVAHLFSGKSHFSLGNFIKAKHHLSKVDSSYEEIYLEAQFTKALSDFQLKNFSDALNVLYEIKESKSRASVRRTAITFYFQLQNYLSLDQRFKAFHSTKYNDVRLDLVKAAFGNVNYASAQTLWKAYVESVEQIDENQFSQIQEILKDSVAYSGRYAPNQYPKAPDGMSYTIGVALPEFSVDSPNFDISRNLYLGIQFAIEEFNSNNSDKKVFVSFKNTIAASNNAESIVNELVWADNVDAIIGPLFSEEAVEFSKYAEEYQIPLLTPLANADHLNLDLSYTFQLNPTFGIHGKTLAQYAVQTLGYDTIAVIADKGSLGEPSAIEFRNEAVDLGAEIIKYYSRDLQSQGFDISEFTDFINPETDTLTNFTIDAIYAPFTGQAAATLIGALLTHLEAMRSNVTLLGSEEWESINLAERNLPSSNLYYTKNFSTTTDLERLDHFNNGYSLRFGSEPDFYSMIGYDAANVILETINKVQNPAFIKDGLKSLRNYQGLISTISFEGTHINQNVKVISRSQE